MSEVADQGARVGQLAALGPDVLRELSVLVDAGVAALEAGEAQGVSLSASIIEDEGFTLVVAPSVRAGAAS